MDSETLFLSADARALAGQMIKRAIKEHVHPVEAIVQDYIPLADGRAIVLGHLLVQKRWIGWSMHRQNDVQHMSLGIGSPTDRRDVIVLAAHKGSWLHQSMYVELDDLWRFLCGDTRTLMGRTIDEWSSGESDYTLSILRAKILEQLAQSEAET